MAKLSMFNHMTLDGHYKGQGGDISWHTFGAEEQEMSGDLSNQGNMLIFGRVTYELMAGYWTSPDAMKNDPLTTNGMNEAKKLVFSTSLAEATWMNTRLVKGNLVEEIRKLKAEDGPNMTILGSGQIVGQLAQAGLIDEYSIMLNPLAIGLGESLFRGLDHIMKLKLQSVRQFKSGNVLLTYTH